MFNNTDKVTQMYLQLDLGCEKRGYKKNLNFISNEQFFLQNVARISSGPKCDSETNMLPAERWCPKDLLPWLWFTSWKSDPNGSKLPKRESSPRPHHLQLWKCPPSLCSLYLLYRVMDVVFFRKNPPPPTTTFLPANLLLFYFEHFLKHSPCLNVHSKIQW